MMKDAKLGSSGQVSTQRPAARTVAYSVAGTAHNAQRLALAGRWGRFNALSPGPAVTAVQRRKLSGTYNDYHDVLRIEQRSLADAGDVD
jgi:hypothetical protein